MRDEVRYGSVILPPRFPHEVSPLPHGFDVLFGRSAQCHIEYRQRELVGGSREVWPLSNSACKALKRPGHSGRSYASIQHKMQPAKMNTDRLVRVRSPGMLRRVGVDGQLMNLAEQRSAAELGSEHFGVDTPALRRSVIVPVIGGSIADRHPQSATRTGILSKSGHLPPRCSRDSLGAAVGCAIASSGGWTTGEWAAASLGNSSDARVDIARSRATTASDAPMGIL